MKFIEGIAVHEIDLGPCIYRVGCAEDVLYDRLNRLYDAYEVPEERVLRDPIAEVRLIDSSVTQRLYDRGEHTLEYGEGFVCPNGHMMFSAPMNMDVDFDSDDPDFVRCGECGETF